ncbi:MAG: hypothetical protein ACI4F2_10640 [Acutalibacteraceae bacterium]
MATTSLRSTAMSLSLKFFFHNSFTVDIITPVAKTSVSALRQSINTDSDFSFHV